MNIMTKRRQRHSPEQIVRKIQDADRILAEGGDVAAVVRELRCHNTALPIFVVKFLIVAETVNLH